MKLTESNSILISIITMFIILGFSYTLRKQYQFLPQMLFISAFIIIISIFVKKYVASLLDSKIKISLWQMQKFGFSRSSAFKKPIPVSLIIPLILSLYSQGIIRFMPLLIHEATPQKYRAAKRFGKKSYYEITEWHNALIAASGIFTPLILTIIAYYLGMISFAKISTYYAISNIIPLSNLDGTKIFFGSRILFSILFLITFLFFLIALII